MGDYDIEWIQYTEVDKRLSVMGGQFGESKQYVVIVVGMGVMVMVEVVGEQVIQEEEEEEGERKVEEAGLGMRRGIMLTLQIAVHSQVMQMD